MKPQDDDVVLLILIALVVGLALFLVVVLPVSAEARDTERTACLHLVPAVVVRVIDGDTFVVQAHIWDRQIWEGAIRPRGIDAPEVHSRCQEERTAAARATAALAELLPAGTTVLLCNPQADVYPGRANASVLLSDGTTVSGVLLERGVVRPYDGKHKRPPWCTENER